MTFRTTTLFLVTVGSGVVVDPSQEMLVVDGFLTPIVSSQRGPGTRRRPGVVLNRYTTRGEKLPRERNKFPLNVQGILYSLHVTTSTLLPFEVG